jgi:hypothetical protein
MCQRSIAGALNEQGWDLIALSGHNGPRRILAILNSWPRGIRGRRNDLQCRLNAIAGSADGTFWAVGESCTMRWNGTAFQSYATHASRALKGLWVAPTGEAWVTGLKNRSFTTGGTIKASSGGRAAWPTGATGRHRRCSESAAGAVVAIRHREIVISIVTGGLRRPD